MTILDVATAPPQQQVTPRAKVPYVVPLGYLVLATALTLRFWVGGSLIANKSDNAFFLFVLEHGAKVVSEGINPFFTNAMNAPYGVNLMANTVVLGLGIPLSPVTLLFGADATLALATALGLAGTAAAWFWFLRRHVTSSLTSAAIGGLLCGFGPGMISQANGHPNWTALWMVPLLLHAGIRLARTDRWLRRSAVLGLLVAIQAFLNEEVLLYTAIAGTVFLISYAAVTWPQQRPAIPQVLRGGGVAALVASALLAYPLWQQFFGPMSYRGLPVDVKYYGADLASYPALASRSLGGDPFAALNLAPNLSEQNTFLGWPLLVLLTISVIGWLWARPAVRAVIITGTVFFIFSLGRELIVHHQRTGIPLPWRWLSEVPLLESVLPVRFGLATLPVCAILLVFTLDLIRENMPRDFSGMPLRRLALTAVAVAIVPLTPLPIEAGNARPTPDFIESGQWRNYVAAHQTIVTVPVTSMVYTDAMSWWAKTGGEFAFAGGYFIGPGPRPSSAQFGPPIRPSAMLFERIVESTPTPCRAPAPTVRMRNGLLADLAFWRAGALVLANDQACSTELRRLVDGLLGRGKRTGDVTFWKV